MTLKDYTGRLGRQTLYLQEYTFEINYLPGKENSAADLASRPHNYSLIVTTRNNEIETNTSDIYDDHPLIYYLLNGKHVNGISRKQTQRIERVINN